MTPRDPACFAARSLLQTFQAMRESGVRYACESDVPSPLVRKITTNLVTGYAWEVALQGHLESILRVPIEAAIRVRLEYDPDSRFVSFWTFLLRHNFERNNRFLKQLLVEETTKAMASRPVSVRKELIKRLIAMDDQYQNLEVGRSPCADILKSLSRSDLPIPADRPEMDTENLPRPAESSEIAPDDLPRPWPVEKPENRRL